MNNKQKEYNNNYKKEHYDKFTIRFKKPYGDLVRDKATDLNKSINEYIVDLVISDLDKRD